MIKSGERYYLTVEDAPRRGRKAAPVARKLSAEERTGQLFSEQAMLAGFRLVPVDPPAPKKKAKR